MILSITFFGAISITDTAMNFAKYDGSSKGGCRSSNLSFSLFLLTVLFAASAIKAGSRPLEGAPLDKCVCVREIYSLTPQPGCPMLMWHGSRRLQTPTDLITVCVQTFITVAWTYQVCKFTVHTRSANYTATSLFIQAHALKPIIASSSPPCHVLMNHRCARRHYGPYYGFASPWMKVFTSHKYRDQ